MIKKIIFLVFGVLIIASAISPANAAINQIHKGDTVFIGEEGLVLNSDVFYSSGGVSDTQLAFYSSGNPATTTPAYTTTPSAQSFYVSPSEFSERQGLWYSYPNGSLNGYQSIKVSYPSLALKLYAYRAGGESFDVTNGKIVAGEALDFRIDSNLYPIFMRQGVLAGDEGVDVKLKNTVGATLSSLYDCSGNAVKITGIHPTSSAFFVPSGTLTCVWDTGNSAYQTGSYTIWAECNANKLMDNLGKIPGATITNPIGTLQNKETIEAKFTDAPQHTASTTPASQITQTPLKTAEKTQTPAITETQATEIAPEKTETASATPAQQLPKTPVSIFAVISGILIAIALAAFRKRD